MAGKLSKETILEELAARNVEILEPVENYRTRKPFKCSEGHEWLCTAYDIIERQHLCPHCGYNTELTNDIIDKRVAELNRIRKESGGMRKREAIQRVGDYCGHDKKIEWTCLCCDWKWTSTPHDILFRGVGCPLCHVKSETVVLLALKDYMPEVKIQRQLFLCNYEWEGKTREANCDFYFEVYDQKYIVEYNGKQHYDLVFFGSSVTQEQAEKKLAKQQYRDNVVKKYCKDHDIELIVIDGRKIHGEKKVYPYVKDFLLARGLIDCSGSDNLAA